MRKQFNSLKLLTNNISLNLIVYNIKYLIKILLV